MAIAQHNATSSELAGIATQPSFQARVHLAMADAAWNVYSEDSATAGHTKRAEYAHNVVNGAYNLTEACFLVLTNPSIAAEADPNVPDNAIPDSDIQFAVNSYWNLLAGA